MNQQEELQAIFLKWFKHHGVRTLSQIKQNTTNLCNSYDFEGNGLYLIFYPLVRKGFIEFIGEDQYQIAPSIIFHHQLSSISIGINLTEEQIKHINCIPTEFTIDSLGVIRFVSDTKVAEYISNELNCKFSMPNASVILSNFPKLSDTMINETFSGFTRSIIPDSITVFHYKLRTHQFDEIAKIKAVGIFKMEKEAHRYYFYNGSDCYEIPSRKYNPEAWNIAETFQGVKGDFDFLLYNEKSEQLIIKTINIPILIDRVLRLPSLHLSNGVTTANYKTIYKNISPSIIKQLNRIFETKITVTNE